MKRIIFINRYFFPDHAATGQLLSDLAFHLAAAGRDVRVVTSRQRYDDALAALPERETIKGVSIHRVPTTRFGRKATVGRALDYASFYAAAWQALRREGEPGDLLVAMTDPPLLCLPALSAARRRGLQLVNWFQDLYPEVAVRLGVPLVAGPAGNVLAGWRDEAVRAAVANVVVGERMAAVLGERRAPGAGIHVIPNWCDDEDVVPVAQAENPLRRAWGLDGRFVVGYSGNLGRGHDFATVLGAARRLRDETRIVFLVIGGGVGFDELARRAREGGLAECFRFLPYQDRAQLRLSLGVPDIHWLSLRPELEGLIVPSKFYGIAAAGRPVVAITAGDGEIATLVRQYGCGVVIAPGDDATLAGSLQHLAQDSAAVAAMGVRARGLLDARFTRAQAFARWERLLDALD
jgi:glycosyltransferase involved in cell wall biosynthesis